QRQHQPRKSPLFPYTTLFRSNDERIRIAHRESVDEALKELEQYMQARGGGNKPAITTGKMIAAQFEHTAARPDHQTGYAAPQLQDRKSTRLNSSHVAISYAVF